MENQVPTAWELEVHTFERGAICGLRLNRASAFELLEHRRAGWSRVLNQKICRAASRNEDCAKGKKPHACQPENLRCEGRSERTVACISDLRVCLGRAPNDCLLQNYILAVVLCVAERAVLR